MPQRVAEALKRAADLLAQTSPTPRADAQILLAHGVGRERQWLLSHGESELSQEQAAAFERDCGERAAGKPVAYITGFAGFYKRDFAVNEHVLIPRPETKHLVEDALSFLRGKRAPLVLEAGVGSGAIACTIAAEIPDAIVHGTDISREALEVARHNAARLHVERRCSFIEADVVPQQHAPYDLIVANLPYIPSEDVPVKPDPVGFEPRTALDGGADGLLQYRRLLEAAPELLRPGALLLMEAAPPTIGKLAEAARAALPQAAIEIRRDYAGLERYVFACSK